MFRLALSLLAWDTETFNVVFIKEVSALGLNDLPLQEGLSHSSYAICDSLAATVLNKKCDDNKLFIKAGLFYTGVIAGCNCADDPTPVDENNEYCEVLFSIDRQTAETTVSLLN